MGTAGVTTLATDGMIFLMAEGSDARSHAVADDAGAWAERLGWAYGLIADDPVERSAALLHLTEARGRADDARGRANEMWRLTRPLGAEEQYREPALLGALDAYHRTQRHVIPDALWDRPRRTAIADWPGLPYALLFLEWEARFPQEWTEHAKAWGTKQGLIRDIATIAGDETVRSRLVDLTEIVVRRPYRCKDREYIRFARAVDGNDLRDRLHAACRSDEPWARCHAGFVLWLLDRPEVPATRHVWRSWLTESSAVLL